MPTSREQQAICPRNLTEYRRLLAKLHGEADGIVESWDLDDAHRGERLQYHEGRRDAYDVALYWASEMARVMDRGT